MKKSKWALIGTDKYLLWNAFLSVVNALSSIPQSYTLKIKDWKQWTDSEADNFIHLLKEYYKIDNSIWDDIGLPKQWSDDYFYLWVYIINLSRKQRTILRSELQSDLELYNDC